MAVVGFSGSGKSTLVLCIGQMMRYQKGHIRIGGREVSELSKADMARNIGFVAQAPFIFSGTIEENLRYSYEAGIAGNVHAPDCGLPRLDDMIIVLQQTGLFVDVLHFGLNTVLSGERHRQMMDCLIRVRERFRHQCRDELKKDVEFYHDDQYAYCASIAENLIFGTPRHEDFDNERLYNNDYMVSFLVRAGLYRPLLDLGQGLTRRIVDILEMLPREDVFFEKSPIRPDELETYQRLNRRLIRKSTDRLDPRERKNLLKLALRFSPERHKIMAMPSPLIDLILNARKLFRSEIRRDYPGAYVFYHSSRYMDSETILNNILFGRIKSAGSHAAERVTRGIVRLLVEETLLESIVELGLEYQVGTKGGRLSGGQCQKLAIARVLLKAPQILIMDEATSALDNKSQARIEHLLDVHWRGRSTLIAVAHRLDTITRYDKVAVMKAGKIIEMGTYDELMTRKGGLYELVNARSDAIFNL